MVEVGAGESYGEEGEFADDAEGIAAEGLDVLHGGGFEFGGSFGVVLV